MVQLENLEAELTAENEESHDPDSGPGKGDSLAEAEARAWDRLAGAWNDDNEWIAAYMEWLEANRLLMGL